MKKELRIGLIWPNADRRYKTVHVGLASLAAYAREQHNGLYIRVIDTRVATRRETESFFSDRYDLVGMTVFSPVYYEVIRLFRRLKDQHPQTPVCLGGPYVTTIREEIFRETPASFAMYGEGETTFSSLLFYLKGEVKLTDIQGLMYMDAGGDIRTNPPMPIILDLDSLPMPAYDLFPMKRYPLHRIIASRGCPYACAFCNSSSIWVGGCRRRSPEAVIQEMEWLVQQYGNKIFVFGDNTFNSDTSWVLSLCDLLNRSKHSMRWSASLRADLLTPEVVDAIKMTGCYNASVGIESANDEILQTMNKKTTLADIDRGIQLLKKAGIEIMGQFVIGSPHDTLETVRESIQYAKKAGLDFVNFYTVLPFKGTPQWEYVEKEGRFFTTHIHDFHTVEPRIVFDTPEFPYADRLEAIRLVKKEGFYNNSDVKNGWFDVAKEGSRLLLKILPPSLGDQTYRAMKRVYRLVKRMNRT